jgi:hypothetical protein
MGGVSMLSNCCEWVGNTGGRKWGVIAAATSLSNCTLCCTIRNRGRGGGVSALSDCWKWVRDTGGRRWGGGEG